MVRFLPVSIDEWRRATPGGGGGGRGGGFPTTDVVRLHAAVAHAQAASSDNASSPPPIPWLPFTCQRLQRDHPFGLGIFHGQSPLDFSFTLFIFQLSLIVIIIHIVRFLLKPLRQPQIVAEVIGGIIIGPSVLGYNKKFAAKVFPQNALMAVQNLAVVGFIYFLFVSGVKMDLMVVKSAGRKQVVMALFGVVVPLVSTLVVALLMRSSFDENMAKIASIGAVTSSLAITNFPVLYPVLKELNLLSSDIGRQALSTAIISDIIGFFAINAFEAMTQAEIGGLAWLWYMISSAVIIVVIFIGTRFVMIWVSRQTPHGQAVEPIYIVGTLLATTMWGFVTDFFGMAVGIGTLWFGLSVPDGPPLGATIVDRCETFIMGILLPVSYTFVGLYTDVFQIPRAWSTLVPLLMVALVGYVTKWVSYVVTGLFFNMTIKDSATIGLIMSLRGQVEYLLFIHWMDKQIIGVPGFTLMVVLTTLVTGISTPLISALYDPTRPYIINKRRTIQHHPPDTELRIVACIHDQEGVTGIINLLELSNPTQTTPFEVSALRLIELVGRASPLFIDHQKQLPSLEHTSDNVIHNALRHYEESRGPDIVKIHTFTAVAPLCSMYQDICELCLASKATLLVLPFHKDCLDNHHGAGLVRGGIQSVNSSVLSHSPCSVGVLVDKGPFRNRACAARSSRLAVLFLGGADSREALAYADRMVTNPEVSMTVVRFLVHNCEGDLEMEKKLDDGIVTWFWVKNEGNDRVSYKEVVVGNGEETIAAIRGFSDDSYDLWLVGRKEGVNPVLLQGLSHWSENNELGIVGEFVASADFGCSGSVLVMQQQMLRADGPSEAFRCRFF